MKLNFNIEIGDYRLTAVDKVKTTKSIELLADTAEIYLPEKINNKVAEFKSLLKRGDFVSISFGYDDVLQKEFEGYIQHIVEENGTVLIKCEDSIWLTRKALPNKVLKNVDVIDLLNEVLKVMGKDYQAITSYSRKWDKFVFDNTTGFEVLRKIAEECRLNVFIKDNIIYAHPFGVLYNDNLEAVYDCSRNVEKMDLKYRKVDEKEFEVTVEGIDRKGKRNSVVIGKQNGDKRKILITGVTDIETLKKRGQEELKNLMYDGYEGSITGWLVPFVDAGYSCYLRDPDYPERTGNYMVTAVETEFSVSGGSRKINLGVKLR